MTEQSKLTQDELKKLIEYNQDTGEFFRKYKTRSSKLIDTKPNASTGYIHIRLYNNGESKKYAAHRLAFLYVNGYQPKQVDHINRDRCDNRISNLREADDGINSKNRNKRSDNTSGYTGVTWNESHKKWVARININGNRHLIGEFKEKEEAIFERIKYVKMLDDYTDNHGT